MNAIKHVWFDLEGTLTVHTPEFHTAHNRLRYETYAEIRGQQLNKDVEREYETLYKQYGSNSAVFRSLGLPSDFWQRHYNTMDETQFFKPSQEIIDTLKRLKEIVPISIFTNLKPERNLRTLQVIGVDYKWFTYILTGDDIEERKPAPDGFHLMIERSGIQAGQILYVGDRVDVDISPAKAVGMQTCLLYKKSKKADFCFDTFSKILSLFA